MVELASSILARISAELKFPSSTECGNNILALIKFFVKHCEVFPNGTISFKYHQIPRECISGFNEENPHFEPILEPTIQSLLNILYTLGSIKRVSPEQRVEVNLVLDGKESLGSTLLRIWEKRVPAATDPDLGSYGYFSDNMKYTVPNREVRL